METFKLKLEIPVLCYTLDYFRVFEDSSWSKACQRELNVLIRTKVPGNSLLLTLFCVRVNAVVVTSSDRDPYQARETKKWPA
jgi:hypothetical protein